MSPPASERLHDELALLEAMYPEQITFDEHAREVKYTSPNGSFLLRLPDGYPATPDLPNVLSANAGKRDLREALKQQLKATCVGADGEVLDAIVLAFNELCESTADGDSIAAESARDDRDIANHRSEKSTYATIIVWLHHLLNTNKRKQALSPPAAGVSGVTKPGYPGVLVYSGPAQAVHDHVNDLKQLNWQAFQVRLEDEDEWRFAHGAGVREVESMKEVVMEIGEERKEVFLEAMRMK